MPVFYHAKEKWQDRKTGLLWQAFPGFLLLEGKITNQKFKRGPKTKSVINLVVTFINGRNFFGVLPVYADRVRHILMYDCSLNHTLIYLPYTLPGVHCSQRLYIIVSFRGYMYMDSILLVNARYSTNICSHKYFVQIKLY